MVPYQSYTFRDANSGTSAGGVARVFTLMKLPVALAKRLFNCYLRGRRAVQRAGFRRPTATIPLH